MSGTSEAVGDGDGDREGGRGTHCGATGVVLVIGGVEECGSGVADARLGGEEMTRASDSPLQGVVQRFGTSDPRLDGK